MQATHILNETYASGRLAQRSLHMRVEEATHKAIMASCWEAPGSLPARQAKEGHHVSTPSGKPEVVSGVGTCASRKQQRRARRQTDQPVGSSSNPGEPRSVSNANFWSCLEFDSQKPLEGAALVAARAEKHASRGKVTFEPVPKEDAAPTPRKETFEPSSETTTPALCLHQSQGKKGLPTSATAPDEPAGPKAPPATTQQGTAREDQTAAGRAHHLGTLREKLYSKLHTKAKSAHGALPPARTNAPTPKPAIASTTTGQQPRTGRQATTKAPPNPSTTPSKKPTQGSLPTGWLDFLPNFFPRNHEPDHTS